MLQCIWQWRAGDGNVIIRTVLGLRAGKSFARPPGRRLAPETLILKPESDLKSV